MTASNLFVNSSHASPRLSRLSPLMKQTASAYWRPLYALPVAGSTMKQKVSEHGLLGGYQMELPQKPVADYASKPVNPTSAQSRINERQLSGRRLNWLNGRKMGARSGRWQRRAGRDALGKSRPFAATSANFHSPTPPPAICAIIPALAPESPQPSPSCAVPSVACRLS